MGDCSMLIRLLVLLCVLLLGAAVYNMIKMGSHVGPTAKRGNRNFYAFYLRPEDFSDENGIKFRNRYYLSLTLFVLSLLLLAGVISTLPNGSNI
jgi:hypothetical protein